MSKSLKTDPLEAVLSIDDSFVRMPMRTREFSENDLYRPLSRLYDHTASESGYKRFQSSAAAVAGAGASCLITFFTSEFESILFLSGKAVTLCAKAIAFLLFVFGAVCYAVSRRIEANNASIEKEETIRAIIIQEFYEGVIIPKRDAG